MLDLTLNENYKEPFFFAGQDVLRQRIGRIRDAIEGEKAHLVYLVLESKGIVMPYFLNTPRTMRGFTHQLFQLGYIQNLFLAEATQNELGRVVDQIRLDKGYRDRTFAEFDLSVRPYSRVLHVDLGELFQGYSRPQAEELGRISKACDERSMCLHDRVAMGCIYRVEFMMNTDPAKYFGLERTLGGVLSRQHKDLFSANGLQARVFRALLDFGQYFDDRYREFCEIMG